MKKNIALILIILQILAFSIKAFEASAASSASPEEPLRRTQAVLPGGDILVSYELTNNRSDYISVCFKDEGEFIRDCGACGVAEVAGEDLPIWDVFINDLLEVGTDILDGSFIRMTSPKSISTNWLLRSKSFIQLKTKKLDLGEASFIWRSNDRFTIESYTRSPVKRIEIFGRDKYEGEFSHVSIDGRIDFSAPFVSLFQSTVASDEGITIYGCRKIQLTMDSTYSID